MTFLQDKKINAFDIQSGKLIKWFQQDGDVGDPIKVCGMPVQTLRGFIKISYMSTAGCS